MPNSAQLCDVVPLQILAPGQLAWVEEVYGEREEVHRLAELGLRAGAAVEMVQSGHPCVIRSGGSKLCFRPSDSLTVLVRCGEAA